MRISLLLIFALWLQAVNPGKILECRKSQIGFDYVGRMNTTVSGRQCQRWSSQSPHTHTFTNHLYYPDSTLEDASNYCRIPDGADAGPWCYTTDPDVRWEFCDIPYCHKRCHIKDFPFKVRYFLNRVNTSRLWLGDMRNALMFGSSLTSLKPRLLPLANNTIYFRPARVSSGKPCQPWKSHSKGVTSPPRQDSENFCRNPDNREGGPWCHLAGSQDGEWEYCDVPFCKPSMNCKQSVEGVEYAGTISMTRTGRLCQRWDRQAPHGHDFTEPGAFPDDSLEEVGNMCRNPDGISPGPWCFTVDPDRRWEYCDIKACTDCRSSATGREYSGVLATTTSGLTCQRWDSQSPHPHTMTDADRFPDMDLASASNYCRNPNNDARGPWCYTTDEFIEKDFCDIPHCTGSEWDIRPPLARHVLHIGVDGLKPSCMQDAPGGAINMMERLGAQGAYTLTRARTSLVTVSGPGWSNILCGLSSEYTGITGNGWSPTWRGNDQDISPIIANIPPPCVFRDLKSQDSSIHTAIFYDWFWLRFMANVGFPGMVDWDVFEPEDDYLESDWNLAGNASEYLRNTLISTDRSYTMVYLANVDQVGHDFGWCGENYLQAVNFADQMVGGLLDTLDELGMGEEVLVMLSSDHGGLDYGHGRYADSDLLIPMFVRGPGIKANYQFEFEVENRDIVPTAFYALGLKSSPWWKGQYMREAFVSP